jgi:Ca2+-binding EF-hand superfamily protein
MRQSGGARQGGGDPHGHLPSAFAGGVLSQFREMVLARGGSNGIRTLGSIFRRMDDDRNRSLSAIELQSGCSDYGIRMSLQDASILLSAMDRRKVGSINFDDFLLAIRGPMSKRREDLVRLAFRVLDQKNDGRVDVKDMQAMYDASAHPDVRAGKMSAGQVMREFMLKWDNDGPPDGIITVNEFIKYYQDISASIDRDDYFELMIRNAWHMSGGSGNTANSSNLRVLVVYTDGSQQIVEIQNDMGLSRSDIRGIRTALRRQGVTNIAKVSTAL